MALFIDSISYQSSYLVGTFIALVFGLVLFLIAVIIAIWVYTSFAYMSIAKKIKYKSPNIAWIPYFGPVIIAFSSNKNHKWYPWLLLILLIIPVINLIAILLFICFFVYWNWHLFEKIKMPGWWSIFILIPLANFAFLVLLGVAAWSKK